MWRKVRINPCYRIKIRIFFSSPRWIYNSSYINYKFTSNLSLDRSLYISYFPIIFRSLGTAYQDRSLMHLRFSTEHSSRKKKYRDRKKELLKPTRPRNLPVSQSGKWIEEMFQLSRQMSLGIAGDLDKRSCPPFLIFCPAQEIVTRLHQVTTWLERLARQRTTGPHE